jgi:hypothetical protein
MGRWPVNASLLGFNLANAAGGRRPLLAAVASRNESYM